MKRYQQGGLAAATADEQEQPINVTVQQDPATAGLLQALTSQYTTTPEAHEQARKILEQYYGPDAYKAEEGLLEQMRETAESSRQTLKDARARLLAKEYDPTQMWFNLAGAFGKPTQTGAFGETLGNVGQTMGQEVGRKREFERGREAELLGLDKALGGVDQSLLAQELALTKLRRQAESGLAEKALSTLGKAPQAGPGAKAATQAAQKLDAVYLKEYVPFIGGGSADAAKSIEELEEVVTTLRGGSDTLTGPIVGSISTLKLPYIGDVGKIVQDIMWPTGSNIKEVVESTVQRSLRPILGAQFTEKEGERLIQRVYNPRMEESINAKRLDRLILQLKRAYKEKIRAAHYYQDNNTLFGFKGKVDWKNADFDPDEIPEAEEGEAEALDQELAELRELQEQRRQGEGEEHGGMVGRAQGGPIRRGHMVRSTPHQSAYEKRGHPHMQGGGPVPGLEDLRRETGTPVSDPEAMDVVTGAVGAGLGYLGGGYGADVYSRLEELARPGIPRAGAAEKAILGGLEVGDEDLAETGAEVKRARRQRVPSTIMDVGGRGTRALAEQAITQGGAGAEQVLEDVGERFAGSRERVSERVNQSLKPYAYFDRFDKLQEELYANAKPLYDEAYKKYPGIAEKDVPALAEVMDTPDGKRAVKIALRLLHNQGKKIGREDAVGLVRRPSLEFLDYVKRGFDQIISTEENMGPTALGRSMRELRTRLRNQLDKAAPEYGEARAQYAGDLEVLDALKSGRDEFHRMRPEEVQRYVGAMGPGEKDAYLTGVADRLYQMIDAPTTEVNAARKLIGSPAMAEKIEMLFDRPAEARLFRTALEREMFLYERTKQMSRRGEAGRQRRAAREMGELTDPLADPRRVVGRPLSAVIGLITKRPGVSLTEEQADEITKVLNRGTPQEINDTIAHFAPLQQRRSKVKRRRGKAAGIGATVGAISLPFLRERTPPEE